MRLTVDSRKAVRMKEEFINVVYGGYRLKNYDKKIDKQHIYYMNKVSIMYINYQCEVLENGHQAIVICHELKSINDLLTGYNRSLL